MAIGLEELAEALQNGPQDDKRAEREGLARLVRLAVSAPVTAAPSTNVDPRNCPNCGENCPVSRSPYCSEPCREEAAFVRQFRTALQSGGVSDQDRQAMFGQNLWHLLGGGYPGRIALIPPKALAKVLARGCELCEQPAVSVDNIGSG